MIGAMQNKKPMAVSRKKIGDLLGEVLPKASHDMTLEEFRAMACGRRVDGDIWSEATLRAAYSLGIALELPGVPSFREEPRGRPGAPETKDALLRWRAPARIADVIAGSLEETDAVRAVRRWQEGQFFVLLGPAGVGKSVAAGVAMQRGPIGPCPFAAPQGPDGARYWPHAPFWVRAAQIARGFEAHPTELRRSSVLVIDDLGDESDNTHARSRISELICERDDLKARTVITTNLSAEGLRQRYGRRFVDRLAGHGQLVAIGGQSMRTKR